MPSLLRLLTIVGLLCAVVYGGLGDKDLAFSRLNDALRDHAKEMVSLNVRGELDGLRADARYADLKRRVGLPQ